MKRRRTPQQLRNVLQGYVRRAFKVVRCSLSKEELSRSLLGSGNLVNVASLFSGSACRSFSCHAFAEYIDRNSKCYVALARRDDDGCKSKWYFNICAFRMLTMETALEMVKAGARLYLEDLRFEPCLLAVCDRDLSCGAPNTR